MTFKCLIDLTLLDDCVRCPLEDYSMYNSVYDGETGYYVFECSSKYSDWSEYDKWTNYFEELISEWKPDPNDDCDIDDDFESEK